MEGSFRGDSTELSIVRGTSKLVLYDVQTVYEHGAGKKDIGQGEFDERVVLFKLKCHVL